LKKRLTHLIREIHRRSLWQVLAIYLTGAWGVVGTVDSIASALDLPSWAPRLALFLLVVGLPIVLATAFVQEGVHPAAESEAPATEATPTRKLLTWRNAIIGGVLAFVLLGGAAGFYMLRGRDTSQVIRIAVLPFENEGAAGDEYFADGVADEVRTKLARVPGLEVIARGSSTQYKKTAKQPKEIGRELGVSYLLTGTVRWAKASGGNRVRVSPELIDVGSATTLWTDGIERELSDVFSVQSDIATTVANQLDLTLGTKTQQRLAERPTNNVEAWDAYQHGEEITQSLGIFDVATLRKAQPFYEHAVQLDTAFAEAWSRIARIQTEIARVNPTPEAARSAKHAAETAFALAPHRAAGPLALAAYLRTLAKDFAGSAERLHEALGREPNNTELLDALASAENSLGRFDSALVHLQRARDLNPRSVATRRILAITYIYARKFPQAVQAGQEAIQMSPQNIPLIQTCAWAWALLGQLDSARAVARAALARGVDTTTLIARYALIQEQMWLLPPDLWPKLTRLSPAAFDGDRVHWGLKLGATWRLLGDSARARAFADTAVNAVEVKLRNFPDLAELRELHGRALALAGRRQEAVQEADLSLRLRETSLDAATGPYVKFQVARILIQAGEYDRALEQLEQLVDTPGAPVSRAILRIDPSFTPLKGNPRFERLSGLAV
jgi:TolB-like protein/Flp pilus assembly protein TadD